MGLTSWLRRFFQSGGISTYEIVELELPFRKSRTKRMRGGMGNVRFTFVSRSDATFGVKVGRALGEQDRFAGTPTPTYRVEGKNQSVVIDLNGADFDFDREDFWLVKLTLEVGPPKGRAKLEIFCEETPPETK